MGRSRTGSLNRDWCGMRWRRTRRSSCGTGGYRSCLVGIAMRILYKLFNTTTIAVPTKTTPTKIIMIIMFVTWLRVNNQMRRNQASWMWMMTRRRATNRNRNRNRKCNKVNSILTILNLTTKKGSLVSRPISSQRHNVHSAPCTTILSYSNVFQISRRVEVPSHTIVYRPNDRTILHIPRHHRPARPINAYTRTDHQSRIATAQRASLVAHGAYLYLSATSSTASSGRRGFESFLPNTKEGREVMCCAVCSSILSFDAVISP